MIIADLQDFSKIIAPPCRLLGIDYGKRKLGIAISNPEQTMSLPLQQIADEKLPSRLNAIAQIIKEHAIKGLIIGLPINMDGSSSEQSEIVEKFAKQLLQHFNLPIYLQDERLTSKAANNALKMAGFSRKDRAEVDDQIAASMILETTLTKLHRIYANNKNL
jgi:putative Holliday junction resolvase